MVKVDMLPEISKLILKIILDYKESHDGNSPSLTQIARVAAVDHSVSITSQTAKNHIDQYLGEFVTRDKDGNLVTPYGRWGWYGPEIVYSSENEESPK